MATFPKFCDSPLWNNTEFMTSTWPKFSSCFQDTVLVWAPCAIILVLAPCYIINLGHGNSRQTLGIRPLSAGKLFCQITAAVLTLVSILQRASLHHEGKPSPISTYVADIVKMVTFAATVFLGQHERKRGVTASMLQLAFWTFMSVALVIPAYSQIILKKYLEDFVGVVLFYAIFVLCIACFVLNCWSEHPGTSASSSGTRKKGCTSISLPECPLLHASALSQVFYCWIFSLLRLGFRRDIEESDLWLLPEDMTCDYYMPRFEQLWGQEVLKCERYRKKLENSYKVSFSPRTSRTSPVSQSRERESQLSPTEKTRLADTSKNPRSVYTEFLERTSDYTEPKKVPKPSLIRVLWRQFRCMFFVFTSLKMASDLAVVCGPVLLSVLISFLGHRNPGMEWQGYGVCLLMLMITVFRITIYNFSMMQNYRLGMIVRSLLTAVIYKKSLRINNEAKKRSTVGDVVNLISADAQRIQEFLMRCNFSNTAPFQIIVSVILIYLQIGPAVLVGFLVLILLVPLNMWIASKQGHFMGVNLRVKATRLRIMNEILNGIKALKLYAWEQSFHDRVQQIRAQEIATLLKVAMFYVISGVCWSLAGFLVTLGTFATFTLSDRSNYLDPGRAFMTLALFNILRGPFDLLSSNISLTAQAYVSAKRINEFLLYQEIDNSSIEQTVNSEHAVSFVDADLAWDMTSAPTLKNINLVIPQGKLVAVIGPVGSGKSSLLSAILGDMEKRKGTVAIKGSVAYVPQQAWIQNAMVRDNILFGKTYREKKYRTILSACELERDMSIFSAGDMTEIGEKGTNLSGGQKQRVSVARAVYQDRELYLLDDPLSAVDAHVGKKLFEKVFGPRGLLKNKTRILVTHGVHFLPQVDLIVMMNDGQISEVGTYEELLAHYGPFTQFLEAHLKYEPNSGFHEDDEDEDLEISTIKDNMWDRIEMLTSDATTSGDESRSMRRRRQFTLTVSQRDEKNFLKKVEEQRGKLIVTESLASGRVQLGVYFGYVKAGGLLSLSIAMVTFWCFQATSVGTNYWLTDWTEDSYLSNRTNNLSDLAARNDRYLGIYSLLGLVQGVFLIPFYYLFWTCMVMAGRKLHSEMTSRIFKAPMAFFDTTPVGRIMNRCSRDMEIVDNFLPLTFRDVLTNFGTNFITVVVIMIETPIFGAVLIPVIILFLFNMILYISTARQLKRIEHVTRSPVFTHFSESLSGSSVVRAFGATGNFISESKRRIDYNTTFFFAITICIRWLSVNLDMLAALIVFSAGVFQVMAYGSSGQAGLTVSYALQMSGSLQVMVRQIADLETNIVSVERIKEYSEVAQEADWIVPTKRPRPNWPPVGTVEFRNFSVRYRDGLDLVIKNMNIRIEGGQKVGIVGRTGAGKSSLSLSLFRLMEAADGCILIDGISISDIGLHDLRSRLTILPQDPILFSGSLRLNLDPFKEFTDDEIWTALERAHLKQFVNQLPEKLMYECGEEGHNLSIGQRQLLCLARTLLRKTKILILDEATAAVDMQTDSLIQNTIRFAFQHCTVIAIAHRLNTIMDYDKVMVLDNGMVKEYNAPSKLLEDHNSIFFSMAADANLI